MRIHKRLIDLHSSADVVKQIVSGFRYFSDRKLTVDFHLARAWSGGRGYHCCLNTAMSLDFWRVCPVSLFGISDASLKLWQVLS